MVDENEDVEDLIEVQPQVRGRSNGSSPELGDDLMEHLASRIWRRPVGSPRWKGPSQSAGIVLNRPKRRVEGGRYIWPYRDGIVIEVSRVKASRFGGLEGNIRVTLCGDEINFSTVSLHDAKARGTFAHQTQARHGGNPIFGESWISRIDAHCRWVLKQIKAENKSLVMEDAEVNPESKWLVEPIVRRGMPTALYGDGGTLKTTLGWIIALLAATGEERLGLKAQKANVFYLDWETEASEQKERFDNIRKALHISRSVRNVYYKRMSGPLVDEFDDIYDSAVKHNIDLIIIDSMGMATGLDSSTEATGDLFRCLRKLGCASLILDHVTKSPKDNKAYGSVYKYNLARVAFLATVTSPPLGREVVVTLSNTKDNYGPKQPPMAFSFHFSDEGLSAIQNADVPAAGLPLSDRIEQFLINDDSGQPVHYRTIAQDLNADERAVRTSLSFLKKHGRVINSKRGYWETAKPVIEDDEAV